MQGAGDQQARGHHGNSDHERVEAKAGDQAEQHPQGQADQRADNGKGPDGAIGRDAVAEQE